MHVPTLNPSGAQYLVDGLQTGPANGTCRPVCPLSPGRKNPVMPAGARPRGRPTHDYCQMTRGRKEIPPGEQLLGLRKARDRYQALADQVRNDVDLLQQPEAKLAREQDARRIAHAYEKSIQNMITSCRIRRIDTDASESGSVAVKVALAAFFVVAAGGTVLAVTRPAIPRAVIARIIGGDTAAPQANTRNSAGKAQMPAPRTAPPAPPTVQPAAIAQPVVRATPPARKAEKIRQKSQPVKAAVKDAGGGSFVVKVLQPDGSLKEQSFPATPSR
jgi:hypothetical protein